MNKSRLNYIFFFSSNQYVKIFNQNNTKNIDYYFRQSSVLLTPIFFSSTYQTITYGYNDFALWHLFRLF